MLRPRETWEFEVNLIYGFKSAPKATIRLDIEDEKGNIFDSKEKTNLNKTDFDTISDWLSEEVEIPSELIIDTLFVRVHLTPDGFPEPTASHYIAYQVIKYDWTYMVYLDGDDDLEYNALLDMQEMNSVLGNDTVAVVVQFDRHPEYVSTEPDWSSTRRYFLDEKDYRFKNYGELNMGHPGTLVSFVRWAQLWYPAHHYALVLWDHGDGWTKRTLSGSSLSYQNNPFPELPPGREEIVETFKDIIIDETNNDRLYSWELRSVFANIPKLDVLCMDACLMAMVENVYQFRFGADYIVASQEVEPGVGYPYQDILSVLKNNPETTSYGLAAYTAQLYAGQFSQDTPGITQSATDTWRIGMLKDAIDHLASTLIQKRPWSAVTQALATTKSYHTRPYRDLYHFCEQLKLNSFDTNIQSACDQVMQAVTQAVVANYYSSPEVNSHGLSIYFPTVWYQYNNYYHAENYVDLVMDTQWEDFLIAYLWRKKNVVDTYEVNDTFTQAYGPLKSGDLYVSYISRANEKDFYFIITGETTNLTVDLTMHRDLNYDLVVYDETFTPLGFSISADTLDSITLPNLSAGVYYVEVVSNGYYSVVPYKLKTTYQGLKRALVSLSFDDNEPETMKFSQQTGDVIGTNLKAPDYPMTLEEISFYIADKDAAGTGGDGSFKVWMGDPYGTLVDPFTVTPSALAKAAGTQGWFTVDLREKDIKLTNEFFVGIGYDGENTPALGIDTTDTGRAFQWDAVLQTWKSLHATAFIRAKVRYPESPESILLSMAKNPEALAGETVIVPVENDDIPTPGCDTLEFQIRFDQDILDFVDIMTKNTLTDGWTVENISILPEGRVTIEMTAESATTGSGELLNIKFYAHPTAAVGSVSPLTLEYAILDNGDYMVELASSSLKITGISVVKDDDSISPVEFSLSQNYPNPFNPTTTIQYAIPKSDHLQKVTLDIFNMLGEKVTTLVSEQKHPGFYSVKWDGRNEARLPVPSGVYLYRLRADLFDEVKKMLLMR